MAMSGLHWIQEMQKPDVAETCQENENIDLMVWSPDHNLSEAKLDEYISFAKEKHGYCMDQALGMLFWHKHNIEEALADLPNFTPFHEEWTMEDKVLFEQAFSFHGKVFDKIQKMLPNKSIASLVKFYYSWKKTRSKTGVMALPSRKQKRGREGSNEKKETSGNNPVKQAKKPKKEETKKVTVRHVKKEKHHPKPKTGGRGNS